MRAIGKTDRGRGARDLLHGHDVREVAEIGAAPAFRHGEAVQALGAQLRPQLARELVGAVNLLGQGRNFGARKAAHLGPDLVESVTEAKIEVAGIYVSHQLAPVSYNGAIIRQSGLLRQDRNGDH